MADTTNRVKVGDRYGMLEVERFLYSRLNKRFWLCRCECGGETTAPSGHLRSGNTHSCGCLHRDLCKTRKAGAVARTAEYSVWVKMKSRCLNPKNKSYCNYGGRGITVCERWRDFKSFLADMGTRPSSKHSIDRQDNNGPYSPENCRWATKKQQARNTRKTKFVTLGGDTKSLAEWCDGGAVNYSTAHTRITRQG